MQGEDFVKMSQWSRYFSADGLGLITPPSFNPLYEGLVDGLYPRFLTIFPEWESYLGGLAVLLGAIGLFTARHRRMLFWVLVLAVFTIVSMGSHVQLLGKEFEAVKLPCYFLKELPGFDSMRSPKNLLNVSMLAVAVLAGFGTHRLIQRGFSARTFLANIALSLIVVALLFDYWGWPRSLPISDASVPEFYRELGRDPGEVVVLNIPIPSLGNSKPLYYQTVHGKKMIGGYVTRQRLLPVAEQFINENKFLSSIEVYVAESKPAIEQDEISDALELLRTYPEIEYVVLAKKHAYIFETEHYTPLNSFHRYSPWLQSLFGQPMYEDGEIQVFKVGSVEASGTGK